MKQTQTLKFSLIAAILLVTILALAWYWHHEAAYPETDDAYVKAHIIYVAPEVAGAVVAVNVAENQHVQKGQVLFQIDRKPFEIALAQAEAAVSLARQDTAALEQSVGTASANRDHARADLDLAKKDFDRTMALVKDGRLAVATGDTIKAKLAGAKASLDAAEKQYQTNQAKLGQHDEKNAAVRQAKAVVAQAQWRLDHTTVSAASDGIVSHLELRVGDLASSNAVALALIEDHTAWVEGNFKETQLERIAPGQPVRIQIDMYPHTVFHGTVRTIGHGSGSAFSLFPAENASGNWVKVTQRFPVLVDFKNVPSLPLRLGSSANIQVDTTQ